MTFNRGSMASLFLPNLEFEEELSGSAASGSALKQQRLRDLEPVMAHLSENPADVVLTDPLALPDDLPPCLETVRFLSEKDVRGRSLTGCRLVPWGWSPRAVHLADRLGLGTARPTAEAVRQANSRRFLVPRDLIVSLPGIPDCGRLTWLAAGSPEDDSDTEVAAAAAAATAAAAAADVPAEPVLFSTPCDSVDAVVASLARFRANSVEEWVIKAEFSHAARNRILGRGSRLSEPHLNWLRRRFSRSEIVVAEPWVQRIAECGLQFEIGPANDIAGGPLQDEHSSEAGTIRFDGAALLINDAAGRYIGSLVASVPGTSRLWRPAVRHGFRLSRELQRAGYFGWLGIDCMVFRAADGQSFLRLSHDLNARCTMGRIALRMKRLMEPGELGFWCHLPAELLTREPGGRERISSVWQPADSVCTVCTSPRRIGQRPAKTPTALLTSSDPDELLHCAQHVRELQQTRTTGL